MIVVLFLVLFAPLILWWTLWLLFAILAALPTPASPSPAESENGSSIAIDILIPAHDEELLLPQLLGTLDSQTVMAHRILVVADHCTDRTAAIAREHGLSVLERSTGPRGKPAALRDGLQWLKENNPSPTSECAILILDADCTISPNFLAEIRSTLQRGADVVQAAYVLNAANAAQSLHNPAQIAFALKNLIRPAGMARLGLPTQLFGTGMCFRQNIFDKISFHDHLTEDLAMSHDLLLCGIHPQFLRNAIVNSPLPQDRSAMSTQKLRWETGQIMTWISLPRMLSRLVVHAQWRSALALIDWSAPPLALAVIYWLGATFAMTLLVALGDASAWLLLLPLFTLLSITAYVIIGGVQVAGTSAVAKLFLAAPRFAFWKATLYGKMLAGRGAKTWQRTPRTAAELVETHVGPEVLIRK
jgi:cellulose synthase/poly-beta-1,6-N-acetylglucosamine synthase-like glycosyltransferase